ncbi:serine carboxypeptidase S28 [Oesophagostomum dentatum]|uniref:Serine carboxypeptidase S28 n=1 Tax=Oesophagostomum dentatum TaxID=61180 RepID=A0A0B1RRF8_OESDE|nr:serine carboxypeptidase S28 [Oesophagostomum dentatum]
MCSFMNNASYRAIENIARFNEYMTAFYSKEEFNFTENSYEEFIEHLKGAQQLGPKAGASWLWTWQTCTEFGYFQSSDSGYSIFGSPSPVNLFTRMCTDLYGEQYTAMALQKSIDKTNNFYGGIDFYRGTNVVIPNGSIDPWHALGKYSSNDPSVVYHLINGTAHCADMYPAREQDPPDLVATRKLIEKNIEKWLNSAEATSTSTWRTDTASWQPSPTSKSTLHTSPGKPRRHLPLI